MKKTYVVYKKDDKLRLRHAAIFTPEHCEEKAPVCFWFHGGGWVAGNECEPEDLSRYFEKIGMKIISVEYILCDDDVHFESLIADCSDFLRYFSAHSDEFGIDINRCVFAGISAGGHLCQLEGMIGERFGTDDGTPFPKPCAVLDMCGPTDLTDLWKIWTKDFYESVWPPFIGRDRIQDEERIKTISPLHIAQQLDPSSLPPIIAAQGDIDPLVSPEQPKRLQAYYQSVGAEFELVLMHNAGHNLGDCEGKPPAVPTRNEMLNRLIEFAESHCSNKN